MSKPETKSTEVTTLDDDMNVDGTSTGTPSTETKSNKAEVDKEVKGLDADDDDDSKGDPEFVTLTCGKNQFKVKTLFAKVSGLVKTQIAALKKEKTPLDRFVIKLDVTQQPELRDEKGNITHKAVETSSSIDPESLKTVVKWMNLREGCLFPRKLPKPAPFPMKGQLEGVSDEVCDFIEAVADPKIGFEPLLNLTMVAHYLEIQDLEALCNVQWAQWVKRHKDDPSILRFITTSQNSPQPELDKKERKSKVAKKESKKKSK